MTLNGDFLLNSVFAQVHLEFFCMDFKNNHVKTNKETPILSVSGKNVYQALQFLAIQGLFPSQLPMSLFFLVTCQVLIQGIPGNSYV